MLSKSPPPFALSAGAATVTGSGTVVLSNSNGVSFGVNGSTLTASVRTDYQSSGAYLTTAALSQDSSKYAGTGLTTTTTAGTALVGTHNTAGLSLGVPAWLTTAAAAGIAASLSGNSTSGGAGYSNVSSGTLILAGGNNITLSQDGSRVTISGANAGGAQTGISGVAASNTTYTSGTVQFTGVGGGVTVSSNTGQRVDISVAAPVAQTNQTLSLAATSNTAGNTSGMTVDARSLTLQGRGIVSVGFSTSAGGSSVVVSVSQTNVAFSAGAASSTFQTLSFQDSNGVSFSNNAGAVRVTHDLQFTSATSAITSNALNTSVSRVFNVVAATNNTGGGTASLSSNVSFSNANGATFYTSAGNAVALSYSVPNVPAASNSSLTMQAGASTLSSVSRVAFVDSNGVSFGASTSNNGSITITATVKTDYFTSQSNQNVTAANGGFAFQTLSFSNLNGVSFGTSAGSAVTASVAAQTNQTLGLYAVSNTTQSTSGTADARTLSFAGAGIASVGVTNGSVVVSVPAGGGAGDGGVFAGVSTAGNTAGSTGTVSTGNFVLVGTGALTLSQSTGAAGSAATVTISVPASSSLSATGIFSISTNGGTMSMGVGPFSAYAVGNTTLSSSGTPTLASLSFSAGGAASVGVSGGSVVVSAPVQTNQTGNLYAVGNTFGTTSGTFDARTLSISGDSGVQVAASNSGFVVGIEPISQFEVLGDVNPVALATNSTLGQNSLYFIPFDLQVPLSAYRVNFFLSVATTVTAAGSTGRGGYTLSAALYSRGTGASTDRISSFWSGTAGISMTMNSNSQLAITNLAGILNSTAVSTVGTNITSSNATTYPANSVGGYRVVPLPISSVLTQGRYWLAVANSTTSSNAGACVLGASVLQASFSNFVNYRPFGTSSAASNASFYQYVDGAGTYSATSGGFPGSVPLTSDSIRNSQTLVVPYANFSGYTTGTNVL